MNRFLAAIERLFAQVWEAQGDQLLARLEPLILNLRPIWSDPLWQFVGLLVALVLLIVLGVLAVKYLSGFLGKVVDVLAAVVKVPLGWLKSGVAALGQRARAREEQVREHYGWLRSKRLKGGLDTIRYLTTRRDWRYRSSWYLLSGCDACDRSSWVSGQQEGRRAQLLARERQLVAAGSQWHFFDQGVIIDAADSKDYSGTVNLLSLYRPERPVDGLILAVSAEALLDATTLIAQKQLGEQLYRQMWELQKVTGFVVPVYLLVTRCDRINGFQAFWASQPESRHGEMFGWANPARLDTAFNPQWVADAFRQLSDGIHKAQLQVAASGQEIVDVDSFMLFDREFEALQAPLQQVVNSAFARSSFQEALPLRGIWFNGLVNGEPALCSDFLKQKLWPEVHLAYPVERRRFSTNKTLRRLQYGTLAFAAMLLVTLAADTTRIHAYSTRLETDWNDVVAAQMGCGVAAVEEPGATVWWMLSKLTRMGQQPVTVSLPASWFGGQLDALVEDTAHEIHADKLFPDMACRMVQKGSVLAEVDPAATAAAVVADPADLVALQNRELAAATQYMSELAAYQKAQSTFVHLAGPLPGTSGVADDFRALLDYLYDSSIPPEIDFKGPLLERAVMEMTYDEETNELPDVSVLTERLDLTLRQTQQAITLAALQPPLADLQRAFSADTTGDRDLLSVQQHGTEILQSITRFDAWLRNVYNEWLVTDAQSSPCGRLLQQGYELVQQLEAAGYPRRDLDLAMAVLQPDQCDAGIRSGLARLNGELFGNLFTVDSDGHLEFSDTLQQWQQEMQALSGLNIISRSFQFTDTEIARAGDSTALDLIDQSIADGKVVGWLVTPLNDAIDLVLSYQNFRQRWWMTEQGIVEPFYATALQQRMQLLVQALIQRAMVRESATSPTPLMHDRDMEAQLAQRVGGFQKAATAIRQLIQLLAQEGDGGNSVNLNRQARDFVESQLEDLWALVQADRLYTAQSSPDWQRANFADAMFGYGDAAAIGSYLDHQRLRTAYLTQHYARPLVSYLVDNGGVAQTDVNAQRWIDTLVDLRRYERKEPGSNVLQMEQYVTGRLLVQGEADCSAVLQSTPVVSSSHDIFATRQVALDQQLRTHCQAHGQHSVVQEYTALAQRFNADLANRFPFAALDNSSLPEVRLDVANQFFRDYQALWAASGDRAGLYQDLQNLARAQPRLVPKAWLDFVAALERVSVFWNRVMQADDTLQVTLAVQFAALPELSQGTRQIIQWDLGNGNEQLSFPNGGSTLRWKPGDRLQLALRWASGSGYRPARSAQSALQVDDAQRRALFLSQRQWSLFEWLQLFGDPDHNPAQASLLSFQVPVVEAPAIDGSLQAGSTAQIGSAPVPPLAYITRANLLLSYVVTAADGSQQSYALPAALPRVAPGMSQ